MREEELEMYWFIISNALPTCE